MALARALIALSCSRLSSGDVSFASIGDWGGAALNGGDYHKANEMAVARQMGSTCADLDCKFVLNTGDNFYYCGVQNVSDSQFNVTFEDVFRAESLMIPWYGVLGNHDYAYDPVSQFHYTSPNRDRWQLKDYYYSKRVLLGGSQHATIIFIDTSPCIESYRGSDPAGWDPCSDAGHHSGECEETPDHKCHFHDHILSQDCGEQLAWFKRELASAPEEDWLIVVGHHEADYINVEDFTKALLASSAALYLNGHKHAMKHYRVDGRKDIDFVTTGAGSMVKTHDQEVCPAAGACALGEQHGHKAKELYYRKVSAFSTHTFSDDFSKLHTKFFDISGKVLHHFKTKKRGGKGAQVVV